MRSSLNDSGDQVVEGRYIGSELGLKAQLAAGSQNSDTMIPQGSRNEDFIPRTGELTANGAAFRDPTHTGGIDKQPIRLALFNHFGIAGHNRHPGFPGGGFHRSGHFFQDFYG